jgi:hypothetical protein
MLLSWSFGVGAVVFFPQWVQTVVGDTYLGMAQKNMRHELEPPTLRYLKLVKAKHRKNRMRT